MDGASGKFDLYGRHEAYSSIVDLCRELHGTIACWRSNPDMATKFENFSKKMKHKDGSELVCVLTRVIPELEEIVGGQEILMVSHSEIVPTTPSVCFSELLVAFFHL
jgi:hypothetical protein